VEPDRRDAVVDFVWHWSERAEIATYRIIRGLGLSSSKFYDWCERYGKVNEHNGWIPRDHWVEDWEKEALVNFYAEHPLEGYRRLTYMMLDADIVALSPSSVWRVLSQRGLLERWNRKPSKKGTGFVQPEGAHQHWHVDIAYVNLGGTFYYLCSVLDGYSRSLLYWELKESMKEKDVEILVQAARERYPPARPRVISDNGPQFIARDFREFIRLCGMTHVRTSPFYPQSNGKIEAYHKSLRQECLRPRSPQDYAEAWSLVDRYVRHYNEVRLHSAIAYVTPKAMLEGRQKEILQERERKLHQARQERQARRLAEPSPLQGGCNPAPLVV